MKLTKDYIINHMRQTQYPCWSLFVMQNYKRVPIMHYNGDDWQSDDDAAAKTEKAIARLNGALQSGIPSDALLCIELRSSKGANGSQGTLGPFEFYNHDKADEVPTQQPQQQAAGLGGFGFMQPPPGWVSEETLNAKLEGIAVKNEQRINEILLKQREKDFEERRNRELREIAEIKKELKDERRKYESNTGAAADTLVMAIKKILGELFPALPINNAAEAQPATLSGADTSRPTDPKYGAVEALANAMYQDPALTEQDVNEIALAIKQRAAMKHNTPPQQPQEATAVEFPKGAGGTQNV
ncbi:MAG: hypothetical protein J6Q03_00195 [Paludibacteraceae bacterium]|nr:hypothetical protein [Paludibacteraceae bacterium]MBO6102678.1 hypothetical protein [Opitutales bacterium]MBO7144270.1 hypothetical protein [Salinivirgaceae bacterium]